MVRRWNVFMLIAALLAAVVVGLVAVNVGSAQCLNGDCLNGDCRQWRAPQQPLIGIGIERQPHPAWRYEKYAGRYASVVRIRCDLGGGNGALGSGVVVRWGARVVILTAKHVVAGARKIIILPYTRRSYGARVLVVNAWDCAVLQTDQAMEGVTPAEVATPAESVFVDGDRFESCGLGAEGSQLAVNTGRFIGYRRSARRIDDHDDWFEISGPARQGDSGGPIFNKNGRVAGVLWGTNGNVVVGVQVGRLTEVLNEAVTQQAARNPTPYDGWRPAEEIDETSNLPWRKGVEDKLGAIDRNQAEINQKLNMILQGQQQQSPTAVAPPVPVAPPVAEKKPAEEDEPGFKQKILELIAEKGGPIGSRIANKKLEEMGEDPVERSPLVKHLLWVGLAAVVVWIAVSQHRKAGTKTLLEKGTDALSVATAGTPLGPLTAMLDKVVDKTGDQIRALQEKIDAKHAALQAQVTDVALATPPPATKVVAVSPPSVAK